MNDGGGNIKALFQSHCLLGLSKITMFTSTSSEEAEEYARQSLETIQSLASSSSSSSLKTFSFYQNEQNSFSSAVVYHLSTSRRLVAEALLRSSNPQDACTFLQDAAKDSPKDYDVMFALGVFKLRMYLHYSKKEEEAAAAKEAQMQLLRAAKLNTTKPDPFALLGLWYEVKGDAKRAHGCFSKALVLDASHPVAGRGMLRLEEKESDEKSGTTMMTMMKDDTQRLCEAATKSRGGG
eukprot:14282401-Ditylum_brightwellii.AAC.1